MSIQSDFDAVITRIRNNKLWSFPGGVHPPGAKTLSNTSVIANLPIPEILYVPIKQHTGVEGDIIVNEGEYVLKGQALTHSNVPFAVPVHAPTSGKIIAIQPHTSAHPSGVPELAVVIQSDGNDTWCSLAPIPHYQSLERLSVIEAICDAGISGLGGAGFPTHIKVAPTKPIEFLIINGIECEPYISSDDRLMREHAWQIRQGIDVLVHLVQPKCVIIAVEDNKPEALQALTIACQEQPDYLVVNVPTKYPAGGEKQLIQVLTGREVPRKGLPADIGCMMFNVGTCYAIADAIFSGKPLIERVVTVTGKAVSQPQNVWAMLGTPVSHLLSHSGYLPQKQSQQQIIMGGPMMGFTVTSMETPVVKITNCLLLPAQKELPDPNDERACIRCGLCADACPATLLPQQLYWHSKAKEYEKAEEYNLFDCIECGACAYVCPSEIPLVHYYRVAKSDIRNQRDEKDKSEKAKIRFEARKARLLEEKQQREEKHRLAAEQRQQTMSRDGGDAKSKIAAALARAKAKKNEANSEHASENSDIESKDNNVIAKDDKKAQVQAAIARAKAKKAEASSEQTSAGTRVANENDSDIAKDDKKAKVQAAIARAKAKKAQAEDAEQAPVSNAVANENDSVIAKDDKKAKVQAAIVRAKAKKESAEQSANEKPIDNTETRNESTVPQDEASNQTIVANDDEMTPEQIKKQKVAIAIAKAKAKNQALKKKDTSKKS